MARKYSVVVPLNRNDGTKIPVSVRIAIREMFIKAYGGCTVNPKHDGYWEDDGCLYNDSGIVVWSISDDSNGESWLDAIAKEVCVLCDQICVLAWSEEVNSRFVSR